MITDGCAVSHRHEIARRCTQAQRLCQKRGPVHVGYRFSAAGLIGQLRACGLLSEEQSAGMLFIPSQPCLVIRM